MARLFSPPTPDPGQGLPLPEPSQKPRGDGLIGNVQGAGLLGHRAGTRRAENARGGDEENHQIPWEPASGEFTITCSLLINCELDLIN